MPPKEFVLEYRRVHLSENLPRRLLVLVAWNQVHSLLIVRIGHDPRVVQPSRPVKVGLLWPHYHDTAIEHRCTLTRGLLPAVSGRPILAGPIHRAVRPGQPQRGSDLDGRTLARSSE